MPLDVIYVTRHGFRSNWLVDPTTGTYGALIRSPTGNPADPALTSHGVDQARQLAAHLATLNPPVGRVYSSPYYRCLQTVEPFVRQRQQKKGSNESLLVRCEPGIAEWYGSARFEHPTSSTPDVLAGLFPGLLDGAYEPAVVPPRTGETIDQLHDRVAAGVAAVVAQCDAADDGVRAILLCSHAATIIALGRVLTGVMPADVAEADFDAFTCGLSVYRRRRSSTGDGTTSDTMQSRDKNRAQAGPDVSARAQQPRPSWRDGRGVAGGWVCERNSDCSFLAQGEERGWRFSGDESFKDVTNPDAGMGLGRVVEGRRSARDADSHL